MRPSPSGHRPVLLHEALELLNPHPGRLYVDATLGGGGHARAILERLGEGGRLLALDRDPAAIARCQPLVADFSGQCDLVQANFDCLGAVLAERGDVMITGGVLADIGVSSFQLDEAARGFSFSKPAPLDMRMDPAGRTTAAALVNTADEQTLAGIFRDYGEERFARPIARAIVRARTQHPVDTTTALANLIVAVAGRGKPGEIHPATRVFQALRIAVNDELGSLERFLAQLPPLLAPGARVVVISFHSLEDRQVKRFFQAESRDCLCPPRFPVCQCGHRATLRVLTPRPVTPGEAETADNPRARSARLRAAEHL